MKCVGGFLYSIRPGSVEAELGVRYTYIIYNMFSGVDWLLLHSSSLALTVVDFNL